MKLSIHEQLFSLRWWRSWLYILLGCAVMAVGFVFFITPYKIVPGGVYGMGIVLHQLFPSVDVGTFGLIFDIPLLIIAMRVFGRMFGARTVVAAVITPLIMNILTWHFGDDPALMLHGKIDLSDDIIIACIFGGVLIGAGVGFIIRTRATSGGTDIVAMLLSRYTSMSFSKGIFLVDSLVVVFGMLILGDWRLPLYSIVTIFVSSRVIDYVIDGASYDKLLFILSHENDKLRTFIIDEMGRGGTYIKSSGMYTGTDKDMIFVVVSRREVASVQNKVKEIDPQAFLVVVNAYDTYGDGFKSFTEST